MIALSRLQKQRNAPTDGHYHLPILAWLVSWLRHTAVWVGCRHVPAGKLYGPFHGFPALLYQAQTRAVMEREAGQAGLCRQG